MDAEEKGNVNVIDTPNAFIQTRVDNENKMASIKIRGVIVNLLLKIYPELYGHFVATDKKGEKGIIVQCMNAIYITMTNSLLYYKKFLNTLKRTEFQLNPYDPCVANRLVHYNQKFFSST